MLSVPGAKTVRGYSFFGDSFVYVLFDDGTDLYWARSRVLEYLNQVQARLPASAKASLGPDATGRGLDLPVRADRPQRADGCRAAARAAGLVSEIRAEDRCPTWPRWRRSAAWCASTRSCSTRTSWRAYGIPHTQVVDAIRKPTRRAGGSVLELGEAEYMVRASGYLQSLDDFRKVPLVEHRRRRVGAPGRRRAHPGRPRDAPRHRRARTARAKRPAA